MKYFKEEIDYIKKWFYETYGSDYYLQIDFIKKGSDMFINYDAYRFIVFKTIELTENTRIRTDNGIGFDYKEYINLEEVKKEINRAVRKLYLI